MERTIIKTLTSEQERVIREKVEQLQKIIEGINTPREIAQIITQRRLNWLKEYKHPLRDDLPLPEAAYRLLIYNHMNVKEGIIMKMLNENLLCIKCTNFCPYLEAFQRLGLDTRFVCKEIEEPSLHAFFHNINPRLYFRRDYNQIRPYSDYCLEMLGVLK